MVIVKFNPEDILKEKALDVMTPFKNEITSLVTESFFSNQEYRFNFYKILVALFNNNLRKIFVNAYKKYINDIYFIFKGGNIIKAVIDQSEKNVNKKIDSNIYTQQNRSDSDFSIYCNYDNCKKIFLNENNDEDLWTRESENILLKIDNVAYNMLYQFRSLYDSTNETIKIGKEIFKVTDFTDSYKISVKSTVNDENINLLESTIEKIEAHYFELIKNTLNLNFDGKKVTDDENVTNNYLNHQSNFTKKFIDMLLSDKIKYIKNNKNIYIGKNFKYNVEQYMINGHRFPLPYALLIDEDKINGKYNMEEINVNNSVSLEKLYNGSNNIFEKNISSKIGDSEINYCDEEGNVLLDNGQSFVDFREGKSKFLGYNTHINVEENINEQFFNNPKNITKDFNNLIPIENISFNSTLDRNSLYISSNRSLRFSSHLGSTLFNLIRMKQNMILYFKLDNPFILNSKIIQFVWIKIPGEFIDISIPKKEDVGVVHFFTDIKNNLAIRNINYNNKKFKVYTYSDYELIHDLTSILYKETKSKPWLDNKYIKRLNRIFRLFPLILNSNDKKFYNDFEIIIPKFFTSLYIYNNIKNKEVLTKLVNEINIFKKMPVNSNTKEFLSLIFDPFLELSSDILTNNSNDAKDLELSQQYYDTCLKIYNAIIKHFDEYKDKNTTDLLLGGKF